MSLKRILIGLAVGLFVVGQCLGFCSIPGTDIALLLVVGWIRFLFRVVPNLTVRWDLVGSTLVYIAVLAIGSHQFLRWLYRELKRADAPADTAPPAWRWRWTLGGLTLVLLMFAAGTAAVGIAHQTTWLVRSPEPLYQRRSSMGYQFKCASNLRQIGQGLEMYANEQGGRYPDDLLTLPLYEDLEVNNMICPVAPEIPEPGPTTQESIRKLSALREGRYVYFGKGLTTPVDPHRVVVVEPLENHSDNGINVLFGDGHVDWLKRPDAERLLLSLGFERVEITPPHR